MPQEIEDVFNGLHTVIDLYQLALGSRGAYYISFIRNDGNVKYVDDVGRSVIKTLCGTFK
tara:strand:+ start:1592 stop:1771 length:180 start_codon:yes stop_codon:yes gene_type:complete